MEKLRTYRIEEETDVHAPETSGGQYISAISTLAEGSNTDGIDM